MDKLLPSKPSTYLVNRIEAKYGVDLGVANDEKYWEYLEKEGLPSLAKLLKMICKP